MTQYSLDNIDLELNSIKSEEEGKIELCDNITLEQSDISVKDSNESDNSCEQDSFKNTKQKEYCTTVKCDRTYYFQQTREILHYKLEKCIKENSIFI